jgi:hypothetical protein
MTLKRSVSEPRDPAQRGARLLDRGPCIEPEVSMMKILRARHLAVVICGGVSGAAGR